MITDGFRRLCGQLERGPAVTRSAIWVPNPVSPLAGGFPAELIRISGDTETIVEEANRWSSLATNGLVKRVLGPGSPRTTFLVTSAAAFEATWHERPTPLSGERGILFHPIEGEAVRVDSLFWHGQLGFARTTGAQVVLLPYQGERYGLVVIVPDADRTVDDVLSKLTAESFQKLRREMRLETMSVALPKFSISTRLNLVGFLESHGAELACAPGNRFPAFAPGSHLKQVAHATMIEVDVRGTRAASATAAVGGGFGGGTTLTVDKPFVFLIHDTSTGANLFAGICARP